jgi:hypothetical protein
MTDSIEALPTATPTLVLELLEAGLRPLQVVTGLVGEAMLVADGVAPDVAWRVEEAEPSAVKVAQPGPEGDDERLTPLDPRRPAPDLLENLRYAMHGCWQLFAEDLEEDDGADDHDADDGGEDPSTQARVAFVRAVRELAEANRNRLL